MPWARAVTVSAVIPAALIAAVVAFAVSLSPSVPDASWLVLIAFVAGFSLFLGYRVSTRLPRNPVGALIAGNGLVVLLLLGDVYDAVVVRRPGALPEPGPAVAEAMSGTWMLLYLPLALLLLVFPDGRLVSSRWRIVALGLPAVVVLFNAAIVIGTVWPAAWDVAYTVAAPLPVALLGLLVVSVGSVFVRYRRSGPVVRGQLRWLAVAGLSIPITLLLCWLSYLLTERPDLVVIGLVAMYLAVPCAVTVALLARDRVDIDDVLVSTTTYVVLGGAALAVLSAASAAAGLLVARWSTPVAVLVTAVCMLGVAPARRRVQRRMGRWLCPRRERALTALEDLRSRVHRGEAQPEDVQGVLRQALCDPELVVGYGRFDRGASAQLLRSTTGVAVTPIRLGGEEVGVLVAGPDRFRPPQDVADAAGLLVELSRLRAELNHAVQEVEASRTRIMRAGEAERRTLERDLHDGAQQRLVSLGMALRVLQRTNPDSSGLTTALDSAVSEIGTAVAELRQIAQGLRPSSLDEGLGPALANLIRYSPTPVDLDIQARELPDPVTVTSYFVVSEAVTNAVRHASAARIGVRITEQPGRVHVRVYDDGRGGAVPQDGGGLAGLRDRVCAAGGSLDVSSPAGAGTVVEAVLPCGS